MNYPITILFTAVFAGLIQCTMLYGWLSDNLFFTMQKMVGLGILGLATTGLGIAYIKILSSTVKKFWSIKIFMALLFLLANFALFLGFMYLAVNAWIDQPLYLD